MTLSYSMIDLIQNRIVESIMAKTKVKDMTSEIAKAAKELISCLKAGNKIIVCGNGGSAADAQHFAAELVGRYKKERKGLACIALTTDSSILTAWSNDYEYATVVSRQLQSLGKEGDILFGISTSGSSENVMEAVKTAKESGIKSICLLGKDGGKLKGMCAISLVVPSNDTPRIQESHIMIIHILCELIDNEF